MHDKTRFRVVGLGLKTAGDLHQAKVTAGNWRRKLRNTFDEWVDLADVDDREASLRIQREHVEILIDLNGLSKGGRQGILLRRPAPVLLSFLGYPATSGAAVDLIVADRLASPPELRVGAPLLWSVR
jgi:predicted O-linked N-acetylglucosamine transferase (SPINDLY family)